MDNLFHETFICYARKVQQAILKGQFACVNASQHALEIQLTGSSTCFRIWMVNGPEDTQLFRVNGAGWEYAYHEGVVFPRARDVYNILLPCYKRLGLPPREDGYIVVPSMGIGTCTR